MDFAALENTDSTTQLQINLSLWIRLQPDQNYSDCSKQNVLTFLCYNGYQV
jgi:hypothetical protein